MNPFESVFLQNVVAIIEKHLNNKDFNADMLANEMKISRSVLYYKIRNITHLTPHQLIISIKMEKASRMILLSSNNIKEIAYSVGYTEPTNFSRTFKKYFGANPTDYIINKK